MKIIELKQIAMWEGEINGRRKLISKREEKKKQENKKIKQKKKNLKE